MSQSYLTAWLAAFAFTQLIEIPIYRRLLQSSAFEAFGASALSHPIVWFGIFHPAFQASNWHKAILAETFAWLGEALYFHWLFRRQKALWVSLLANAASVALGLLSRALFGGP